MDLIQDIIGLHTCCVVGSTSSSITLRDNVGRSGRSPAHGLDLVQLVALRLLRLLQRDQPAGAHRFRPPGHRNGCGLGVHRGQSWRRCSGAHHPIDHVHDQSRRRCSAVKVVVQMVVLSLLMFLLVVQPHGVHLVGNPSDALLQQHLHSIVVAASGDRRDRNLVRYRSGRRRGSRRRRSTRG